jgi:hypothetical protein
MKPCMKPRHWAAIAWPSREPLTSVLRERRPSRCRPGAAERGRVPDLEKYDWDPQSAPKADPNHLAGRHSRFDRCAFYCPLAGTRLKGFAPPCAPELPARWVAEALWVGLFVCAVCFFEARRSPACDRLLVAGALRSALFVGARRRFAVGRSGAGSAGMVARQAAEICCLRASRQRNTRSRSGMNSEQN